MQIRTKHFNYAFLSTTLYLVLVGTIGALIMGRAFIHPQVWILGGYGDTQQFMWYLGWFWHALMHGQNIFYTHQLNAPVGQNLMWNTSILAESAVFGWLVPMIGPSALYNYLWLLNFILVCLLGRTILHVLGTKELPAFIGGILMGIMPYETSQMLFHLHLWFTSPIFGIILILIKQYQGISSSWRSGALLGLLAVFEFYTSLETCMTFALCLGMFWIIASWQRKAIITIGNKLTWFITVMICILLCAPGVYGLFFLHGKPHGSLLPLGVYVNDLSTLFLPTPVYLVHVPWTAILATHVTGNFWENDGYIGIPVLALLSFGMWLERRNRFIIAAAVTAAIITTLSLGQNMHVAGHVTNIVLPWIFTEPAPFLKDVIPSRLMLYGDILIIIITMFTWSKALKKQVRERYAISLLVVLSALSWFPMAPYYISHQAAGESVILKNPILKKDLSGQPVLVLTSDPSIFMGTMADSDYDFSMVNPYGYTSNLPRRDEIRTFSTAMPNMDSQKISKLLSQTVPETGATRIAYFPVKENDSIPLQWKHELLNYYGKPAFDIDNVEIWNLP